MTPHLHPIATIPPDLQFQSAGRAGSHAQGRAVRARMLALLSAEPMTALELSGRIDLHRAVVLRHLRRMEGIGQVEIVGRRVCAPVWGTVCRSDAA